MDLFIQISSSYLPTVAYIVNNKGWKHRNDDSMLLSDDGAHFTVHLKNNFHTVGHLLAGSFVFRIFHQFCDWQGQSWPLCNREGHRCTMNWSGITQVIGCSFEQVSNIIRIQYRVPYAMNKYCQRSLWNISIPETNSYICCYFSRAI